MTLIRQSETRDILLVQRADIDFYPPVINQANLLAENGLRVAILDGGSRLGTVGLHRNVSLIRPLHVVSSRYKKIDSAWNKRVINNLIFLWTMNNAGFIHGIKAHIVYDSPAMAALGLIHLPGFSIYHFHEYPEITSNQFGSLINLEHRLARRFSHRADMLVMPDAYRANALVESEKLVDLPRIVRNCPRRIQTLPKGKLREIVKKEKPDAKWIVLFQGAISPNYYADKIIDSIHWWPEESVMVFLGPSKNSMLQKLIMRADHLGVLDKVFFLPQVPYDELFTYTVDADIGLGMIRPVTLNFSHMAGASNKRYEFIACGIPQITNIGTGMKELIEDEGIGLCIDAEEPEAIGRAVNYLLTNHYLRIEMSKRARNLHLTKYNYDIQFSPLLKTVQSICLTEND